MQARLPHDWSKPVQNAEHLKTKPKTGNGLVSRVLIAVLVCFVIASAGCRTGVRVKYACPFGPANSAVVDEELDGALDDAPATLDRMIMIDFECGFDKEG